MRSIGPHQVAYTLRDRPSHEHWAGGDRGLRVLARIIARAHLRRRGVPVSEVSDSTTQTNDGSHAGKLDASFEGVEGEE